MNFRLQFEIPKGELDLSIDAKTVFLGSCFADNISDRLIYHGLQVTANPFGTLFHPESISYQLRSSLNEESEVHVLERNGVFLDWMSASKVAAASEDELRIKINGLRSLFLDDLKEAQLLVVSFGTAWGYRRADLNQKVGNCHKQPSQEFEKSLFDVATVFNEWRELIQELHKVNPSLKIILTVSPVRHVKDGLIENNRSKARLIELVHQLCKEKGVYYFPAYEILIDELRDYRFYSEDLVHPNKLAVDYIFEKFFQYAYSEDAKKDLKEIISYIRLRDHKAIHAFSSEEQDRKRVEADKREYLLSKFSWIRI